MTGIMRDSKYRDACGERIWFPSDGKPYFDRALQKTFHTIQEKHEYMTRNKLIMDGSSQKIKKPLEAGDVDWKVR